MPPVIDLERCEPCGTCYDICPQDVFSFDGENTPQIVYPGECWHCGACVMDCPKQAVHLELPLPMHIVPSPALYGPPDEDKEADALRRAAAFSRSVIKDR